MAALRELLFFMPGGRHAKGEIGLAYMDLSRLELHLSSIPDTSSYARVVAKLHVHPPAELLFPATAYSAGGVSKLYSTLSHHFDGDTSFATLNRSHFNETRGLEEIQHLCVAEYATVLMDIQSRSRVVRYLCINCPLTC